jgi:hypothetical protein
MGDETRVAQKQQEMPIPDDTLPDEENSDHFIDDEILYESQSPPLLADLRRGTAWHSGQRISLRSHRPPKNDHYRHFRSQLLNQRRDQRPRIRPLCRRPLLLDSYLEPEPTNPFMS